MKDEGRESGKYISKFTLFQYSELFCFIGTRESFFFLLISFFSFGEDLNTEQ